MISSSGPLGLLDKDTFCYPHELYYYTPLLSFLAPLLPPPSSPPHQPYPPNSLTLCYVIAVPIACLTRNPVAKALPCRLEQTLVVSALPPPSHPPETQTLVVPQKTTHQKTRPEVP